MESRQKWKPNGILKTKAIYQPINRIWKCFLLTTKTITLDTSLSPRNTVSLNSRWSCHHFPHSAPGYVANIENWSKCLRIMMISQMLVIITIAVTKMVPCSWMLSPLKHFPTWDLEHWGKNRQWSNLITCPHRALDLELKKNLPSNTGKNVKTARSGRKDLGLGKELINIFSQNTSTTPSL